MGDTYNSAAEAEADRARQKLRSTRVELEPIGLTEYGQRYRVTYAGPDVNDNASSQRCDLKQIKIEKAREFSAQYARARRFAEHHREIENRDGSRGAGCMPTHLAMHYIENTPIR